MNLQQEADEAVHSFGQHVMYALIDEGFSQDQIMRLGEALVLVGADGIHSVDEGKLRGLRDKQRGWAFMYFGLSAIAREHVGRIDPRLANMLRKMAEETEQKLRRAKKRLGLDWLVPIQWGT